MQDNCLDVWWPLYEIDTVKFIVVIGQIGVCNYLVCNRTMWYVTAGQVCNCWTNLMYLLISAGQSRIVDLLGFFNLVSGRF